MDKQIDIVRWGSPAGTETDGGVGVIDGFPDADDELLLKTLDELGRRIALGGFQELNVILKADVDGSIEALADSLIRLDADVDRFGLLTEDALTEKLRIQLETFNIRIKQMYGCLH